MADSMDHGAFAEQFGIGKVRPDGAVIELDETMRAGERRARVLDCVDQWLKRGDIDPRHHEAAENFRRDYYDSQKTPRYAALGGERVDKSHAADVPMSDRQVIAERTVRRAVSNMGLIVSSAIIAIVAEQEAMDAYSSRTGRNVQVVKGIVIGGLDVLARVYRI